MHVGSIITPTCTCMDPAPVGSASHCRLQIYQYSCYISYHYHYRLQIKVKVQGQLVPCMHPEPIRICFINERQCLHAHQAAGEAAAAWQISSPEFHVRVAPAGYAASPVRIVSAIFYHFLPSLHHFEWPFVQH